MTGRNRKAFTLIELVVVVVIIGTIIGLLVPALLGARESSRRTQCTNNQKQLATAIIDYDTAKKHLPGYANQVAGAAVSWVVTALPYLERNDLWQLWQSGTPPPNPPRLNVLVCPDDFPPSTVRAPLSYVVDAGVYGGPSSPPPGIPASKPPQSSLPLSASDTNMDVPGVVLPPNPTATPPSPGGLGIFRNYTGTTPDPQVSLSDVRSPSNTVMLSEKPFVRMPARQWTDPGGSPYGHFYFSWPNYPPLALPVEQPDSSYITPTNSAPLPNTVIARPFIVTAANIEYWPPLASVHPGITIVTFCDGHVQAVPNDTPCSTYSAVP